MADISKINAVALANIAKLDAVLAANIAKVNGLVFTAGAEFLLDTYTGAAAGYSVRRLATSATVLLRVRRDTAGGTGDDDEADVAYDSNNILSLDSAISNASVGVTATTLGQFLNVGTVGGTTYTNPDSLTVTASCFVDEWKDQSGNANHASQATQGSQPQIHDGTVDTDLITENGKPALDFDGSDDGLTLSSLTYGNALSLISVYNQTDDLRGRIWCDDITGQQGYWILFGAETQNAGFDAQKFYFNDGAGYDDKVHQNAPINQQNLLNIFFTSSQMINSLNGNAATTSITGFTPPIDLSGSSAGFAIANSGNMTQAAAMKGQEFILYHSDQSSNRTGIESDINTYFSIY